MRLETPRLVIRSFEPADAQGMLGVFGDPDVRRYLPPFPDPTLETMHASVARRMTMEREHGHGLWAVERKDTGELIGDCGLMRVEGTASYYGLNGLKKYVADRATWRVP